MKNKKYIEKLGFDKLGKEWYLLIDETVKDIADFYVFSSENRNREVESKAFHEMRSIVNKSGDEAILVDFNHIVCDISYRDPGAKASPRTNWENRGIGTLLLKRIEEWSKVKGLKTIRGFLHPVDNIEKLKYFYSKMGWIVEIPTTTKYEHPPMISKGIGMVYKAL